MGTILDRRNLHSDLARALRSLMERPHATACVLLEDRATQKFVQFGRGPELLLDLPLIGLSESERERARDAFSALGTEKSRTVEAPDVNGESLARTFEVLQHSFGADADEAATAALKVFNHVYRLDEAVYVLHEH